LGREASTGPRFGVSAFIKIQRAVRDERWKLICYPKISHMQLFDLQTDPYEKTNLIDRVEYASTSSDC